MTTADRARAYLAKLPPAIAGQGGHGATFAAACRLVEFGLSEADALAALSEWNLTHCEPHWTQVQLSHKLADAFKRTAPKPHLAPAAPPSAQRPFFRGSGQRTTNQNASYPILARPIPPPTPKNGGGSGIADLAAKLHPGAADELCALANLRRLSVAGLALASARGLLRFGEHYGRPTWFVLDRSHRNACARRLDGHAWTPDGAKSFLIRNSQAAWPVGIGEAESFPTVLLVEGAPDLLAAFHFLAELDRADACAPVAMLSGSYNIPVDLRPAFATKRVRIFAHDDATGYAAAARWTAQLQPHASHVDAFSFAGVLGRDGTPAKDLNDFAHAEPTTDNDDLKSDLLP